MVHPVRMDIPVPPAQLALLDLQEPLLMQLLLLTVKAMAIITLKHQPLTMDKLEQKLPSEPFKIVLSLLLTC